MKIVVFGPCSVLGAEIPLKDILAHIWGKLWQRASLKNRWDDKVNNLAFGPKWAIARSLA